MGSLLFAPLVYKIWHNQRPAYCPEAQTDTVAGNQWLIRMSDKGRFWVVHIPGKKSQLPGYGEKPSY